MITEDENLHLCQFNDEEDDSWGEATNLGEKTNTETLEPAALLKLLASSLFKLHILTTNA